MLTPTKHFQNSSSRLIFNQTLFENPGQKIKRSSRNIQRRDCSGQFNKNLISGRNRLHVNIADTAARVRFNCNINAGEIAQKGENGTKKEERKDSCEVNQPHGKRSGVSPGGFAEDGN